MKMADNVLIIAILGAALLNLQGKIVHHKRKLKIRIIVSNYWFFGALCEVVERVDWTVRVEDCL